ncbi:MAG: alpha/beta fold hydrolase [Rhizomicrobium sp.]
MATYVLVHGHMHGAWCWAKVTPLLEDMGHRAVTLDLPREGAHEAVSLANFVAAAEEVVLAQEGPVVLVGHSAGGAVISEIAEHMPEKVERLVYVAAMLLPDGESMFSAFITKSPLDPAIAVDGATAFKSDDTLIRRRFYNTSTDEDAAWAVARLCAEPIPPMTHPVRVTPERYGRVKRAFIQTLKDNAVPVDAQRQMCEALPCEVIEMDTDHSPFLCRPHEFAAHLDRLRA